MVFKKNTYSIRKTKIAVGSVLIGASLLSTQIKADEIETASPATEAVAQPTEDLSESLPETASTVVTDLDATVNLSPVADVDVLPTDVSATALDEGELALETLPVAEEEEDGYQPYDRIDLNEVIPNTKEEVPSTSYKAEDEGYATPQSFDDVKSNVLKYGQQKSADLIDSQMAQDNFAAIEKAKEEVRAENGSLISTEYRAKLTNDERLVEYTVKNVSGILNRMEGGTINGIRGHLVSSLTDDIRSQMVHLMGEEKDIPESVKPQYYSFVQALAFDYIDNFIQKSAVDVDDLKKMNMSNLYSGRKLADNEKLTIYLPYKKLDEYAKRLSRDFTTNDIVNDNADVSHAFNFKMNNMILNRVRFAYKVNTEVESTFEDRYASHVRQPSTDIPVGTTKEIKATVHGISDTVSDYVVNPFTGELFKNRTYSEMTPHEPSSYITEVVKKTEPGIMLVGVSPDKIRDVEIATPYSLEDLGLKEISTEYRAMGPDFLLELAKQHAEGVKPIVPTEQTNEFKLVKTIQADPAYSQILNENGTPYYVATDQEKWGEKIPTTEEELTQHITDYYNKALQKFEEFKATHQLKTFTEEELTQRQFSEQLIKTGKDLYSYELHKSLRIRPVTRLEYVINNARSAADLKANNDQMSSEELAYRLRYAQAYAYDTIDTFYTGKVDPTDSFNFDRDFWSSTERRIKQQLKEFIDANEHQVLVNNVQIANDDRLALYTGTYNFNGDVAIVDETKRPGYRTDYSNENYKRTRKIQVSSQKPISQEVYSNIKYQVAGFDLNLPMGHIRKDTNDMRRAFDSATTYDDYDVDPLTGKLTFKERIEDIKPHENNVTLVNVYIGIAPTSEAVNVTAGDKPKLIQVEFIHDKNNTYAGNGHYDVNADSVTKFTGSITTNAWSGSDKDPETQRNTYVLPVDLMKVQSGELVKIYDGHGDVEVSFKTNHAYNDAQKLLQQSANGYAFRGYAAIHDYLKDKLEYDAKTDTYRVDTSILGDLSKIPNKYSSDEIRNHKYPAIYMFNNKSDAQVTEDQAIEVIRHTDELFTDETRVIHQGTPTRHTMTVTLGQDTFKQHLYDYETFDESKVQAELNDQLKQAIADFEKHYEIAKTTLFTTERLESEEVSDLPKGGRNIATQLNQIYDLKTETLDNGVIRTTLKVNHEKYDVSFDDGLREYIYPKETIYVRDTVVGTPTLIETGTKVRAIEHRDVITETEVEFGRDEIPTNRLLKGQSEKIRDGLKGKILKKEAFELVNGEIPENAVPISTESTTTQPQNEVWEVGTVEPVERTRKVTLVRATEQSEHVPTTAKTDFGTVTMGQYAMLADVTNGPVSEKSISLVAKDVDLSEGLPAEVRDGNAIYRLIRVDAPTDAVLQTANVYAIQPTSDSDVVLTAVYKKVVLVEEIERTPIPATSHDIPTLTLPDGEIGKIVPPQEGTKIITRVYEGDENGVKQPGSPLVSERETIIPAVDGSRQVGSAERLPLKQRVVIRYVDYKGDEIQSRTQLAEQTIGEFAYLQQPDNVRRATLLSSNVQAMNLSQYRQEILTPSSDVHYRLVDVTNEKGQVINDLSAYIPELEFTNAEMAQTPHNVEDVITIKYDTYRYKTREEDILGDVEYKFVNQRNEDIKPSETRREIVKRATIQDVSINDGEFTEDMRTEMGTNVQVGDAVNYTNTIVQNETDENEIQSHDEHVFVTRTGPAADSLIPANDKTTVTYTYVTSKHSRGIDAIDETGRVTLELVDQNGTVLSTQDREIEIRGKQVAWTKVNDEPKVYGETIEFGSGQYDVNDLVPPVVTIDEIEFTRVSDNGKLTGQVTSQQPNALAVVTYKVKLPQAPTETINELNATFGKDETENKATLTVKFVNHLGNDVKTSHAEERVVSKTVQPWYEVDGARTLEQVVTTPVQATYDVAALAVTDLTVDQIEYVLDRVDGSLADTLTQDTVVTVHYRPKTVNVGEDVVEHEKSLTIKHVDAHGTSLTPDNVLTAVTEEEVTEWKQVEGRGKEVIRTFTRPVDAAYTVTPQNELIVDEKVFKLKEVQGDLTGQINNQTVVVVYHLQPEVAPTRDPLPEATLVETTEQEEIQKTLTVRTVDENATQLKDDQVTTHLVERITRKYATINGVKGLIDETSETIDVPYNVQADETISHDGHEYKLVQVDGELTGQVNNQVITLTYKVKLPKAPELDELKEAPTPWIHDKPKDYPTVDPKPEITIEMKVPSDYPTVDLPEAPTPWIHDKPKDYPTVDPKPEITIETKVPSDYPTVEPKPELTIEMKVPNDHPTVDLPTLTIEPNTPETPKDKPNLSEEPQPVVDKPQTGQQLAHTGVTDPNLLGMVATSIMSGLGLAAVNRKKKN